MKCSLTFFKQNSLPDVSTGNGIVFRRILFFLLLCINIILPASAFSFVTADYLFEFGSQGKDAGMFREPLALATDKTGDVFVADTKNHRIQVFGPTGDFVRQWGEKGSEPGRFDSPSGIAFGNDKIYIADTGNHRIQIFDSQGNYLDFFGSKGSDPKEFRGPKGLAWWNKLLYIADTGNNRIQVFTDEGIFLYQISAAKDRSWSIDEPFSISVDQTGNIYVVGNKGRVDIYSSKGKAIVPRAINGNAVSLGPDGIYVANKSRIFRFYHDASLRQFFTSDGSNELKINSRGEQIQETLSEISALTINEMRNLYVLASKQGTIKVFRLNEDPGNFEPVQMPSSVAFSQDIPLSSQIVLSHFNDLVFTFDKKLKKLTFLNQPEERSSRNDDLWVVDTESHCLHKFSKDGELLFTFTGKNPINGQFSYPSDIALHNNYLYVADSGNAKIQMLDLNGQYINSFGEKESNKGNFSSPVAIAFDKKNNCYVVDKKLNKVVKMDSSGNFIREFGNEGEEDGQFREPMGIFIVNEEVYILDSRNNRIQVFDTDGIFLRKFASEGKGKGEFLRPSSMYIDSLFNVYIDDRRNGRLQVLRLLLTPSKPRVIRAEGAIKEVKISWLPNPESHVVAYRISRKQKDQSDFEEIGKVDGTASFSKFAYFDKNLKSNTTYYYAVTAVSQTGNYSLMSNVVEATTRSLIPSAPKLLKSEAGQKDIYLEWKPSPEPFTDHYLIMKIDENWQSYRELKKTTGHSYKDANLTPNTRYKYKIVAVGIENDLSDPTLFEVTTMKLPALEIRTGETEDIFSNNYKYYESHPFGKMFIKNNTENTITDIKIRISVREYMDSPTESIIEKIDGGEAIETTLHAVFNNKILALTENSSVPAEIEVAYFENNELKTASLTKPLRIFEKHSLIWDKIARASVFITPKDPLLLELATSSTSGYENDSLNSNLLKAKAVFESLGIMGLTYMQDPNNPYQMVSQDITVVDFLQYPRETLKRKAGDCDDLVVLYASMLEGLGINTAFVAYPGHIFLMFDTSVSDLASDNFGFPPDDYIFYKGTIWIPVETTLVGSAFRVAWKKALDEFKEWDNKGLQIVEMSDAWNDFKPATLEYSDLLIERITPAKIETTFPGEIESLKQRRIAHLSSLILGGREAPGSLEQLAILYGENGKYREAMETLERYISNNGENATALNNMANLYFLQGNYTNAEKLYLKALQYEGDDTGILVNLARCFSRQNKKEKARRYLEMALRIDPQAAKKYFRLSSELRR